MTRPPTSERTRRFTSLTLPEGEEPRRGHRVGPWSPVTSVVPVPALTGGDSAEVHQVAGECPLEMSSGKTLTEPRAQGTFGPKPVAGSVLVILPPTELVPLTATDLPSGDLRRTRQRNSTTKPT